MSTQPPPSQYFPTIYYNPQFWSGTTDNSNYLLRIGTPTSIATSTSFSGAVIANTLASTTTATIGTDLNVTNRNKLSSVKTVSGTTTLVNGDPEYINIAPTSSTAFTITLPRCDVSTKIGTKFSFFFTDPNSYYPVITIEVNNSTFERIWETYSPVMSFTISSLNLINAIELVCIAINASLTSAVVWSTNTVATDYSLFAYVGIPNTFTDTNSFASTTTFTGSIVANGLTITPTELGYIDGVTSNIQTQLNGKVGLSGANTFTATNTFTGSCLVVTPASTDISTKAVNTTFLNSKLRVNDTLNNLSSGLNALANVTTGYGNVAFSTSSTQFLTDGYNNIGIGQQANCSHNGYNNIAIGVGALASTPSQIVTNNVAIGYLALSTCLTGADGNFALGASCLTSLSTGTNNCIMGYYGGGAMTTANYNSGVGYGVLNTITSGSNNSGLGVGAGSGVLLGNSNTFLGTSSGASGDFSEGTAVGFGAVIGANNEIALGRSTETTKVYGNLITVGTTTATGVINSNGGIVNTGTITSTGRITANGGITNINGMNLFSSNTLQTGAFTISSPFFHVYPVAPTATQTITLPTPVVGLLGVTFTIRRVGGTTTVAINSNINIYQITNTLTTVILGSGGYTTTITCTYITASTYGWFKIV